MGNKTTKQMLIELYETERDQNRCTIVHELKKEAEKLAGPYKIEKGRLQIELSKLTDEEAEIRREIYRIDTKEEKHLIKEKLYNFVSKSCGDAIHPDLVAFDTETRNYIREILETK